jgi:tol-pal system protein YbgF
MAGLVLAIAFSAPVSAQETDRQMMGNLVVQVQELQDEVRTLRGMLEEQARELDNLKRRQRDQYLDLDQRLSEVANAQPISSNRGYVTTQAGTQAAPPQDVPDIRDPIDSQSQVTGIGDPTTQTQAIAASPENEKAAYDQAFQALKELRYADAAEAFQSFLDQYPTSDYADNAQYWLGESYYVTRNYDIALTAFQDLLDQFPESPKAPDALLKIGYTHYELEQWDSARAALTQVQENYPDSTLSRLAENRLRSMRMEGHY